MTRTSHIPFEEAYAACDHQGHIIPNSVSDTIQGVRLRAGEGPVVRVRIVPVTEEKES